MKQPDGPDVIYGALFEAVQSQRIFSDSKTFVDATPKTHVTSIMSAFREVDRNDPGAVRDFVIQNFLVPDEDTADGMIDTVLPVRERIDALWDALSRAADRVDPNSSLIPLPRPYVVPGGRFREVYYWDSYFSMLGLAEAGRYSAIEDMVENFAYLIDEIGFIPNGNRSYFCTRSQPPVFVLMVELLAEVRQNPSIFQRYLPQLEKEYQFWMRSADTLGDPGDATRRVVKVESGCLNRYWDDSDQPRQESYVEDCEHAAAAGRDKRDYYRNIRAGCESGWDFSSRWLDASGSLESVRTTEVLPVDLNSLLYSLETCLARTYRDIDEDRHHSYRELAGHRLELLRARFFDNARGFFGDLNVADLKPTGIDSLAAAFPLFLNIATDEQAEQVADRINEKFLRSGGWVTTLTRSGQQWDQPNGWAPLQWVVYRGLKNYGFDEEARLGATRWVKDNIDVYRRTGRLLEKYDVERIDALAVGGEYAVQDGFGWTNGVLLKLMNELGL